MTKVKMGPQHLLNPKPVVLVGTFIDNKPNFITVSWLGNTSSNPPTISFAIRNIRYSKLGIHENRTFSINIPSVNMVQETDYCGSHSGSQLDKVKECGFSVFYSKLKNAPLINQCTVILECKVLQDVNIGDHTIFVGEIIESYVNDNCFKDEIPNITKINPLCFCALSPNSMGYYKVGKLIKKI